LARPSVRPPGWGWRLTDCYWPTEATSLTRADRCGGRPMVQPNFPLFSLALGGKSPGSGVCFAGCYPTATLPSGKSFSWLPSGRPRGMGRDKDQAARRPTRPRHQHPRRWLAVSGASNRIADQWSHEHLKEVKFHGGWSTDFRGGFDSSRLPSTVGWRGGAWRTEGQRRG
jgi:hypothetical protein